jgi:hypothetical protein
LSGCTACVQSQGDCGTVILSQTPYLLFMRHGNY